MTALDLALNSLLRPGVGLLVVDEHVDALARRRHMPGNQVDDLVRAGLGPHVVGRSLAGVIVESARLRDLTTTGSPPLDAEALLGVRLEGAAYRDPEAAVAMARAHGAAMVELRSNRRPGQFRRGESHVDVPGLVAAAKAAQRAAVLPVLSVAPPSLHTSSLAVITAVTVNALHAVVAQSQAAGLDLSRVVIRVNLVAPGIRAAQRSVDTVARATVDALEESLPPTVPGVFFMSGGRPLAEVCDQMSAVRELVTERGLPWRISFAMGRALMRDAVSGWPDGDLPRATQQLVSACSAMSQAVVSSLSGR